MVAADLDDDGRLDLFVANDQSPNYFFRGLGGRKFEEVAAMSGLAGNANGGFQAGMGVAFGDLDGDGRPDLGVTNFYNESMTHFHNLGGGVFTDHTRESGWRSRRVIDSGSAPRSSTLTTTGTSTSPSPMATSTISGRRSRTPCPPNSSSATSAGGT